MPGTRIPLPDLECPAFASLLLAGGATPPELLHLGAPERAMIPLLERPLATYALTALERCSAIDAITLLGPPATASLAQSPRVTWVADTGTMLGNLMAGLTALADREWVLIVGCDSPLITSEICENLLAECAQAEADIYYPIVPKDVLEKKYPGGKRTWVTLREGTYTGGNLFLVRPSAILNNRQLFERVLAARKNPLALAGIFGLPFIAKLLLKHLAIGELEQRAATLLKAQVQAVVVPHPEIGIDLDKAADHAQLTAILQKKQEKKTGFFASLPA